MRDTPAYDLIVVMDRYDRQEVVREVRALPGSVPAGCSWHAGRAAGRAADAPPYTAPPPASSAPLTTLITNTPSLSFGGAQISVLERLNPGGAYLTRVHRLNHFARAGQLVFKDRCLLVRGAIGQSGHKQSGRRGLAYVGRETVAPACACMGWASVSSPHPMAKQPATRLACVAAFFLRLTAPSSGDMPFGSTIGGGFTMPAMPQEDCACGMGQAATLLSLGRQQ